MIFTRNNVLLLVKMSVILNNVAFITQFLILKNKFIVYHQVGINMPTKNEKNSIFFDLWEINNIFGSNQ